MTRPLLAGFALLFSLSAFAKVQTVEIYTYDTMPPFAYRDPEGQLTGVYVEMVRRAVARMPDYAVEFKVVPWQRAKALAKNGSAFAILPPYFHAHDWLIDADDRTAQRESSLKKAPEKKQQRSSEREKEQRPYIWPYSLPLFTQYDLVVCQYDVVTEPRIRFPEDFTDLSFVMWRGDGRAGETFDEMAKAKKLKVEYVNDLQTSVKLLLMGRADCTVTSRIPYAWILHQLRTNQQFEKYRSTTRLKEVMILSANSGYLGYTDVDDEKNFPFKKDFSIKFDIEVYKMKRSGEDQRIFKQFIYQYLQDVTAESLRSLETPFEDL